MDTFWSYNEELIMPIDLYEPFETSPNASQNMTNPQISPYPNTNNQIYPQQMSQVTSPNPQLNENQIDLPNQDEVMKKTNEGDNNQEDNPAPPSALNNNFK